MMRAAFVKLAVAVAVAVAVATTSCAEPAPSTQTGPPPLLPAPLPRATPSAASKHDVIDDFPAASVPLDQISLRSTSPRQALATIELPDGSRHIVKIGSMIGRSYGQVKEIREGEIVVGEETRDAEGRRQARDVTVRVKAQ